MGATIKDIAKRTGLSIATVSKYINGGRLREKNRAAIQAAIKDLDFTVNSFARGLKTRKSQMIGVVIPELSNAFITSIITVVEDILRRRGYAVIVCDCRSDERLEREAVDFLVEKRVDAILNMPTTASGRHLDAALLRRIPIVLVDRMVPRLAGMVSAVLVDNVEASERATAYLLGAGHLDIGIILGPRGTYTAERRREGFETAFHGRNLEADASLIVFSDYTIDGGYESMKRLLNRAKRPTAVFVTNYEMTMGAMIAINEARVRIPDDLSFVGFDKQELFQVVYPDLAVVKQPRNAIGESAAGALLALLDAGASAAASHRVVTLSASLQPGDSVRRFGREA